MVAKPKRARESQGSRRSCTYCRTMATGEVSIHSSYISLFFIAFLSNIPASKRSFCYFVDLMLITCFCILSSISVCRPHQAMKVHSQHQTFLYEQVKVTAGTFKSHFNKELNTKFCTHFSQLLPQHYNITTHHW